MRQRVNQIKKLSHNELNCSSNYDYVTTIGNGEQKKMDSNENYVEITDFNSKR